MITCNLDGNLTWMPERTDEDTGADIPASVGKVCAWGGFTIADISSEVPEGEREEYARKFAASEDVISALRNIANYPGVREYVGTIVHDKCLDALRKAGCD